jgi:hypothetical protein
MLDRHLACIVALAALVFAVVAQGQYSTAPNGYYPFGYAGSTFTGNLESVDAENQGLTLTYTKGGKVERFAGRLMAACKWKDKNDVQHESRVSDLSKGAVLTAFYSARTRKSGGAKITENLVIGLSYAEIDGKKISDDKRILIFCTKDNAVQFKAFQ